MKEQKSTIKSKLAIIGILLMSQVFVYPSSAWAQVLSGVTLSAPSDPIQIKHIVIDAIPQKTSTLENIQLFNNGAPVLNALPVQSPQLTSAPTTNPAVIT